MQYNISICVWVPWRPIVTGSVVQHQGWQCCEQWCLCSPVGKGFLCGTRPGWGEESVPGCASGLVSGFPWNKPQTTSVPLSVPFRTIPNLCFPTQNYLRIHVGKSQRARIQRLFLLLYFDWYTILSQFMVYNCWFYTLLYWKIITTIALSDNWIMSHHYLFCMCGENLDLLS